MTGRDINVAGVSHPVPVPERLANMVEECDAYKGDYLKTWENDNHSFAEQLGRLVGDRVKDKTRTLRKALVRERAARKYAMQLYAYHRLRKCDAVSEIEIIPPDDDGASEEPFDRDAEGEFTFLTERECRVLLYRSADIMVKAYGDGSSALTLEKVGEMIGVSRERVRQIEVKALRKLRHPSRRPGDV